MRARGTGAFLAACLADCGKSDLTAADHVPAVHPAGDGVCGGLRCATALSAADSPGGGLPGWWILPDRRGGRLPVSAGERRRRTAGLHGSGGRRRRGAVFLRSLPRAAGRLGLLGGCGYVFCTNVVPSHDLDEKNSQKNLALWEKTLLFCPKILYNTKNWVHLDISQRRRRIWQAKNARKRNPAPRQVF